MQKYKVFISDKPLILAGRDIETGDGLVMAHDSKATLKAIVEELERSNGLTSAVVWHKDINELWKDFTALYELQEAAGGLVRNELGQLLFIFRRGKWDLPKGKLDEGETPAQAALREVKEECGLKSLRITAEHGATFHTYVLKNKSVLKQTHWFDMEAPSTEELIPQEGEDITGIRWFGQQELSVPLGNTYASIREIVQ